MTGPLVSEESCGDVTAHVWGPDLTGCFHITLSGGPDDVLCVRLTREQFRAVRFAMVEASVAECVEEVEHG